MSRASSRIGSFWHAAAAPAECAAVVKADGYGLGASVIAKALAKAGCRLFFVATLDEALALRKTLPETFEIAMLNGLMPGSGEELAEAQLVPVLNDPGQIAEWQRIAAARGPLPAMLHVDSGMARLGLTTREFDRVADNLCRPGPIRWRAVMSHLACAEIPDHPLNPDATRDLYVAMPPDARRAREPCRLIGDLSRPRLPLRSGPPGSRALRRQPAAGPAQPDAPNCPAEGKNPANPRR